jgi:hypothetical protein
VRLKIILTFFCLLFFSLPALAASKSAISPLEMFGFAESLLSEGDTFSAATEYKRLLYHFGEDKKLKKRALLGLGYSYISAARFSDAAGVYETLFFEYSSPETRSLYGTTLYRANRYGEASGILLPGGESKNRNDTSIATLAWLKEGARGFKAPELNEKIIDDYFAIEKKSAGLAGTLSALLPGSGHLYVERPRDALLAFLLNGLFIWGAFEAVEREEWGAAALLGGAELFWYSGTIVGSMNGAHKYNARQEERFFKKWETSAHPGWSFWGADKGGGLLYSFLW